MILDPNTAIKVENFHSIEEVGLVREEKCNDFNADQRTLKQEQPQATYTTKLDDTLQNKATVVMLPETFKALITAGSPDNFYIQLESSFSQLDELEVLLEPASSWPKLEQVVVGQLCAALFDGSFYRAKILSLSDNGMSSKGKLV